MAPRASRRKVVRDDEDDEEQEASGPSTRQKPSNGKLKPVNRGKTATKSVASQASPQKSKAKGKSGGPPAPTQSGGKPIYSFFNTATQRQHDSQPSTGNGSLSALHEEVEAIHDDSEDERPTTDATITLAQGSGTALAMRKRKFAALQGKENGENGPKVSSQKFRGTSGDEKSSHRPEEAKRPWTERFAPADLSELAVHKRKVGDVRNWLEMTYRGQRQKVLVLKGPAGSGKSTTARLLAKDLNIELLEWRDATASDYASEGSASTSENFQEFVARAGKIRGLELSMKAEAAASSAAALDTQSHETTDHHQALLIEEFPNTFSRTSNTLQAFRSTLSQFVCSPVPPGILPVPMIMVISETLLSTNTATADSFTAHRLLGPELGTNPYINTIEFNPVAPTYLTKALETIVIKEARRSGRRRTPGPLVLKHLAETGDIRSAVSSLEFLCVRNDDGDAWSSKITFTKSKQSKAQPPLTKAEEDALKLISNRESSLGIFHAVGKVVYNKRVDPPVGQDAPQPPSWLSRERRSKIPETDADSLIDEMGTDTSTFIAALHENYALSCPSSNSEQALESLSECIDNLSSSDLLSLDRFSFGTRAFSGTATDTLRQDEMSFQVAVRGLLFSLPHPVQRGESSSGRRGDAFRMFYPASLRVWRKQDEIEGKLSMVVSRLNKRAPSNNASTGGGVDSWKQNGSFQANAQASQANEVDVGTQISSEVRNEMLLERLPYMARILGGHKSSSRTWKDLSDQITTITRLDEPTMANGDEEEEGPPEVEQASLSTEQWSTDRPTEEGVSALTSPRKRRSPDKPTIAFEGLILPVQSVEKLVLEDDDIED